MEENKNTLGGFEAIFDSFIPKVNKEETEEIIDNNEEGSVTDDELEEIKNNQEEPALKQVKNTKKEDKEEQDEENNKNIKEPETKENEIKEDSEEPSFDEEQMVGGFFDAISEKLGWEFDENEEKTLAPACDDRSGGPVRRLFHSPVCWRQRTERSGHHCIRHLGSTRQRLCQRTLSALDSSDCGLGGKPRHDHVR